MLRKIDSIFRINSMGHTLDRRFEPNFAYDGEAHNFWEIVYVDEGKIEVVEDDNVYLMNEGDIIFHAPMEFHRIRTADNTNPHVLNLSFTAEGELPAKIKDGIFKLNNEESNDFIKIFNYVKEEFFRENDFNPHICFEVSCRMCTFILRLTRNTPAKEAISTSVSAMTYKTVVRLMNEEVCSNLSIDELAKMSYISKSYIKSLFNSYAGTSPKQYYSGLRIESAKRFLRQGMTVKHVAEKMNFSSVNHFIRFFKAHTGYTPLQYKNNIPL